MFCLFFQVKFDQLSILRIFTTLDDAAKFYSYWKWSIRLLRPIKSKSPWFVFDSWKGQKRILFSLWKVKAKREKESSTKRGGWIGMIIKFYDINYNEILLPDGLRYVINLWRGVSLSLSALFFIHIKIRSEGHSFSRVALLEFFGPWKR